jgi:regulator of replication initiation timing
MDNKAGANPKKDPSKVILIGIILILFAVIGYMVFSKHQKDEVISDREKAVDSIRIQKDQTVKDLEELKARYEKLAEEKEALGLETVSLRAKIEELSKALQSAGNKTAEVKKLREKLTAFQGDYIKMKDDYEMLIRDNDKLRYKLDSMHKKASDMEEKVANLSAEKSELAAKVAIASLLKAENLKVSVINSKGKEIKEDPFKQKIISRIKVAFTLGDNKVAKKGPKQIYLRLIEPDGSTLFEGDKIFVVNGREAFYTEKKTINFDNSRQQVAFIYEKGSAYKPGKYSIEIYSDENIIGEGEFTVK